MRPLEWVLMLGSALLLVGWAAGWRLRRRFPLVLAAVMVIHLALEGPRLVAWPLYLIVAIAALVVGLRRGAPAPKRGRWRALGRWAVALPLVLLVVPLPWLWPVMRLPAPSGPYAVGTTWIVVADSGRRERFAGSGVREFPVKLWYPVTAGTTGAMAQYATAAEMGFGTIPSIVFDQTRLVRTHSLVDAPLAAGQDRFPTLVFSHGFGGYAAQNTPQMEELASLGYLVASIVHPGEASAAPFPDGRVLRFDRSLGETLRKQAAKETVAKMMAVIARLDSAKTAAERSAAFRAFIDQTPEPLRSESLVEWAADTRALVDRLERLDAGAIASPFTNRLDLQRLGVFGMSYGGATAGEFCRVDRRCKAGLNIDGGQFGALVEDSLSVPFFILASEQAYSLHVPVLDLTRGPAYLVKVPGSTHIGLTDMTLLAPVLFRWTGVTGRLDPDRRERIMTQYLVAFFDTYLKGNRSPLLAGPSTADPDVTFVVRNSP